MVNKKKSRLGIYDIINVRSTFKKGAGCRKKKFHQFFFLNK